jgi:hypothetical protein
MGSALGFSGCRNYQNIKLLTMLHYFGVSSIGILGCAMTGELALGFHGILNSETPNSKHAPLFQGFLHWGFHMSGFWDLRVEGNSHLGTTGTDIPKC